MNIHVQNIIAIQDPLLDSLSLSISSQNYQQEKTTKSIENEIFAYEDSSTWQNETFRVFSQSDNEDDEQRPTKKFQSSNSGFNRVKSKPVPTTTTSKKFQGTISTKASSSTSTVVQTNQPQPIETDLNIEGKSYCLSKQKMFFVLSDFNNDFFSDW